MTASDKGRIVVLGRNKERVAAVVGELQDMSCDVEHLQDFDALLTALYAGRHIRYSTHYYTCGPNPAETIGGAEIISKCL